MAIGDEKVVVNVKDIDHGEILYTDPAGKERTYYPCHGIWLDVQTLEVSTVLNDAKDEDGAPSLSTRARGIAQLEDRSISVVGDPKSKVRSLAITFEAGDWKPDAEPAEGILSGLSSRLGGAMLGFNRADWEIGNEDEWWIHCYLPKPFIDALVVDIRSGQIDVMKLGLKLRGLYTTEHSFAPISSRGDLFIRPDRRDNSLAIPDTAAGYVRSIHFTSAPRDLRKPEPVEPEDIDDDEDLPPRLPAPAPDPVAVSITALAARVDQTRRTLKWIGGFIVLALLFIAAK